MRRTPRLLVAAIAVTGLASVVTSCGVAAPPSLSVGTRAATTAVAPTPATTSLAPAPVTSLSASPSPDTPSASTAARAATAPMAAAPVPSPGTTVPSGAWAIGDSVMLGSRRLLNAAGIRVDAVVSRQFGQAVSRLRAVRRTGHLPANVIVHLGTNGVVTLADCRELVDAAGSRRRVFLVTVHASRSWIARDNVRLRTCAASYAAHHVVLIDWSSAAAQHPKWFGSDGIHPDIPGRRAYTGLITRALAASRI